MALPLKPKLTCEPCGIDTFDLGCELCVELLRMANGCACTCKDMGFVVCPTFGKITNCACTDGTKEEHNILTGAWVGITITDALAALLLDLAARDCPGNPHMYWRLWGSVYVPETDSTSTNINCPSTTTGWQQLQIDGDYTKIDFAGGSLVEGDESACIGGAFFISIGDVGIDFRPKPAGAGPGTVSCDQFGGCVALMMEIGTPCGLDGGSPMRRVMLCPFPGLTGIPFECQIPPEFCEEWNLDILEQGCLIRYTFTHVAGECSLVCTVTIGDEDPFVLDPADGDVQAFDRTVDPCPGGSIHTRVQKAWDPLCIHECVSRNSDNTYDFTA